MFDKYLCKKYHSKEIIIEMLWNSITESKYFKPFIQAIWAFDILGLSFMLCMNVYPMYGLKWTVALGVIGFVVVCGISILFGEACLRWLFPLKIAHCPLNQAGGK